MKESTENAKLAVPDMELEKLRALLFGAERERLDVLERDTNDADAFQQRVVDGLSEALVTRSERDDSVAEALAPAVANSIGESVKNNPEPLADALYPVMGPAIRRSITETMNQTLENFNRVLEQSLSPRSVKWRLQAMVSGKSFAEVALLNSLDYQVEQVFLIHADTSLLLQHAVAEAVTVRDGDMVSGMLSAITDFVQDSFTVDSSDTLNRLRLGELTVCVEPGPEAILAAVVRGSVPEELRERMIDAIESVHRQFLSPLKKFEGDVSEFDGAQPMLEACLISHKKTEKVKSDKPPVMALVAGAAALAIFGYLFYSSHTHNKLTEQTVAALNAEPGIVVTRISTDNGLHIEGLRDPLAQPIDTLIPAETREELNLSTEFHAWQSLDETLVSRRIEKSIKLMPEGIAATLDGSTLRVSGNLEADTASAWLTHLSLIPGVSQLDTESLDIISSEPPTLAAAEPSADLLALSDKIENETFYFAPGELELGEKSIEQVTRVATNIGVLVNEARRQGIDVAVRARASALAASLDRADGVDVVYSIEGRRNNKDTSQARSGSARYVTLSLQFSILDQ